MTRIPLVEKLDMEPEVAEMVEAIEASAGDSTGIRVLAHRPDIMRDFLRFYSALQTQGMLSRKLVELVRLGIAQINQCANCLAGRYQDSMDQGLTEELIALLPLAQSSDQFNDREKVAISFGQKMARDHWSVTDADFARLYIYFSNEEIVELLMLVAQFIGIGRMFSVIDAMNPVCNIRGADTRRLRAPHREREDVLESETVCVAIADGIATLTLNRPERLNALNHEILGALLDALRRIALDPGVRCVVITGADRGFCAGGDISEMAFDESEHEDAIDKAKRHNEVPRLLHEMTKPTIAMVNGPAAGAGLNLALACDLRIAGESARFGTAFVRVGFSGDFGGTWTLQHLVGPAKARELYFTGDFIDAREAERIGLVNSTVPDDKLLETTMDLASRLAAASPIAVAHMKRNLNLALHSDFPTVLDAEAQAMILTGETPESEEARRAFLDKRRPEP